MKKVFVLVLLGILPFLLGSIWLPPSDEEVIQAFLDCPEIVAAQKELAGHAQPETPRIVLANSGCGAAGCQFTFLVAQRFVRRKADPMTTHVLGIVGAGPLNNVIRVTKVELISSEELRQLREAARKPQ